MLLLNPGRFGFSPAQLNPELYLRPSDATTITLAGPDVSAITDLSGNGNDFSGAVGDRPLYDTVGIGGSNTLDHDAAGTEELVSDAVIPHNIGAGDFYLSMLIRPETLPAGNNTFFKGGLNFEWFFETTNPRFFDGAATLTFPSLNAVAGTPYLYELWRDGTSLRLRRNNVLDTDSRTSSGNVGTSQIFRLGNDGGTAWLDGNLGGGVMVGSLPSQGLRDANRDFWASEWSLTL